MTDDQQTRIEAAVFRRLRDHLQANTDVQNIDLMLLADFCRNCLGKWYVAAAEAEGVDLDPMDARDIVYGMPYAEWKPRTSFRRTRRSWRRSRPSRLRDRGRWRRVRAECPRRPTPRA